MGEKSRLRRAISNWANSTDQDARDTRRTFAEAGPDVVTIESAPDRTMVEVRGKIRAVTLRPRGGAPALEAELYDGSAVLTLIFLGRRRIAGIDPGRAMRVRGRIGRQADVRTMYNPRYELLP